AGRAAALSRLTTPSQPNALAIVDACGYADSQGAGLGHAARAVALRALVTVVDDRADALAIAAWLGQAKCALVAGDQAGAVAHRASVGRRARTSATAVAGGADAWRPQRGRHGDATDGIAEVERYLGLDVAATSLPTAGGTCAGAAREDGPEQIGEPGAAKAAIATSTGGLAEQVAHVESAARRRCGCATARR